MIPAARCPAAGRAPSTRTDRFDIIGDVHGQLPELRALLERMGYEPKGNGYRHPERRVIFLGDFVDRGPWQREVIALARSMVEAGDALSVMGNHEYNAVAFFTPDGFGGHVRPRNVRTRRQHRAFLDAFETDPRGWRDAVEWFRTLPLWLDLGSIRVVHACWEPTLMRRVEDLQGGSHLLGDALLHASGRRGTWEFEAIETLLKGKELPLPRGHAYRDKEGHRRHRIRVRWWDGAATTYRAAFMGPESTVTHIPDDPIDGDHLIEYSHDACPVVLGHYWLEGKPAPLAPNIACVDYSIGKPSGQLVAYRF
ncbi:MAG: metallophosphoesterase, partial [Planctomycetota bacterium]